MNRIYIFIAIFSVFLSQSIMAQKKYKTDANVVGHVVCCGEHIPFATVMVKGTTMGITTDESGHYQLLHMPEGKFTIVAQSLGFKSLEKVVTIKKGQTLELKFELEKDVLGIDEVVVTGDRNESNRVESSTIVNTLSSKLFATTQSVTLNEGLNFTPGLRMEYNCQNCGFSQVRMNGMEGPYSQILINSRPIFSGLAGVYGLELIPANMIERVEVIRGGGSALYGSNAIAGTINLILKDPINNAYEFGTNSSVTGFGVENRGSLAYDHSINGNASLVSADNKTGMSIYGFYRDKDPFDANGDGLSEQTKAANTTFGTRLFHRFSARNRISADFFNIREKRRGGDRFDYPYHEANIAEALDHSITTGALTYDQFFTGNNKLSVFISGQKVGRDSYYGAKQSLSDYGRTDDFSYTFGIQYNLELDRSTLVVGIENDGAWLKDKKLGFPDYENATLVDGVLEIPHTENVLIADQKTNTTGAFGQYEISLNQLKLSAGARFDRYIISDNENGAEDKSGNVFSPRVTAKYNIRDYLQARVSYGQGYRVPQIFDEDLHIETSGSRKVIHKNSIDLKQETSHSFTASLDYNKRIGNTYIGVLVEAFHTILNNPFVNEFGDPDENGTVTYTRINADEGAAVQGINLELNFIPSDRISFKGGFTLQSSEFEEAQEFDEKSFFRTPGDYGYFTLDWRPAKGFGISSTGNYTGKMLVPFFGISLADPEAGELRTSNPFFDLGLKMRYQFKLNGASMQLFAGMKNVFNSYQTDFDSGVERDPGYIYGPNLPRTIYVGIKIGNFIK